MGSTFLTGLVDSKSISQFNDKLDTLEKKWLLNDTGPVNKFCSWLRQYEVPVLCDTMLLPVREKAGLGSPPDPFFTNSSECINFVLKVKLDYKRNEMTVLVNKICELIEDHQREVEKALINTGKYSLHPMYMGLGIMVPNVKRSKETTTEDSMRNFYRLQNMNVVRKPCYM